MVGTARVQPPVPDQPNPRLMDESLEARYWARVDFHGKQIEHMDTRCWGWKGTRTNRYGTVPNGRQKWCYAHRISYEIHFGKPAGLVCHHCDNRECTNPEHLYDGNFSTNMKDFIARGSHNS